MALQKERIACLDGLRALSILLVILGHLAGTRAFPVHANMLSSSLALFGVRVFFVISGFLITGILFTQVDESGGVQLGSFYFRRTLRIFVPYYAFLTAVFVLDRVGVLAIPAGDLTAAATYTSNYNPNAAWPLAHTWSLSVEEQFYLVWPALIALLGRRRALWAAALVVLTLPLVRVGLWQLAPSLREGIGHRFETCADSLAMGCLLAGLRGWLGQRRAYVAFVRSRLWLGAAAIALAALVLDNHPRAAFALGWSFQNLAIALVIDACLRLPKTTLVTLLTTRPAVVLGRMSYSVYLWQQMFLDRESAAAMCRFPLNLVGVAVCACLSYYAVELTSLALRHQLEARLFRTRREERAVPLVANAQR